MSTEKEERLFKKFRILKQYKTLSDDEIRDIVKKKIEGQEKVDEDKSLLEELDIEGMFIDKDEKKESKQLLRKYLNTYTIETISERNTLKQLVFLEVFNNRLQRELNNYYKEQQPAPTKTVESLHSNLYQINSLKDKLGLSVDKKEKSLNEGYSIVDTLFKKWKIWREENQGSRTLSCISKGSLILLPNFTTKKIEDINIGEEIVGIKKIDKQGLQLVKQKVLNKFNNGKKRVLKLRTNTGRELVCTPDHLIFSHFRSKNTRASNSDYFPAENCLRRELKTFNYIENLEEYYRGVLIGLIESDGWTYTPKNKEHPDWNFTKRFYICQSHKKETDSIEFVLNFLNIKWAKKFREHREGYDWGDGAFTYSISYEQSELVEDLRVNIYKTRDRLFGFLAGFILGDGHVDSLGNEYITQKNKTELVLDVCKILQLKVIGCKNLGGNNIEHFSLRKQVPLIFPNSKKTNKFLNRIFSSGNHYIKEEIISLELLDEEIEVYDLTTETHNFISNGIIVHNCPYCGKMILLKIRTDIWETLKHPFFKDRILANPHLMELYRVGKISKHDVAKVLGTSLDYIDWLIKKVYYKEFNKPSPVIEIEELESGITEDVIQLPN